MNKARIVLTNFEVEPDTDNKPIKPYREFALDVEKEKPQTAPPPGSYNPGFPSITTEKCPNPRIRPPVLAKGVGNFNRVPGPGTYNIEKNLLRPKTVGDNVRLKANKSADVVDNRACNLGPGTYSPKLAGKEITFRSVMTPKSHVRPRRKIDPHNLDVTEKYLPDPKEQHLIPHTSSTARLGPGSYFKNLNDKDRVEMALPGGYIGVKIPTECELEGRSPGPQAYSPSTSFNFTPLSPSPRLKHEYSISSSFTMDGRLVHGTWNKKGLATGSLKDFSFSNKKSLSRPPTRLARRSSTR
mmetsp:Transcript_26575/g.26822  ORF Transcript_26575/g.26822 Transcript_26575/m.26822 type:complete len:298 (+) Transcript_26575:203-1096(+)|eukprot:CAMPEP_0182432866 /NCGR_PEP_ID=MMETSP1167-20130531/59445_1 /TAXON_ID=2988 /ORGANISM="Mallomonas Sp, Strain CCMP3275" /LENGTH=297 /DNA_ID=CAMNT_0024620897 /DNA_START=84 /DNA_END=977 /DNA_ORIENTATION=-